MIIFFDIFFLLKKIKYKIIFGYGLLNLIKFIFYFVFIFIKKIYSGKVRLGLKVSCLKLIDLRLVFVF